MSFKGKLNNYLSISVEKGIISEQQKKDIVNVVETDSSNIGFFGILSIIGASCIGLGILLIIASNWGYFPKFIQLLMALALPVIPLLVGYYFSYIQKELKVLGTGFIYLSGFLIGASIALIGQIYNTDGNVGGLFVLWFMLLLPVLYVFRFKVLSLLSISLFYMAFYYYVVEEWSLFRNEETILMICFVVPGLIAIGSYLLNRATNKEYNYFLFPLFALSVKISLIASFLATIEDSLHFIEIPFIQNLIFIVYALFVVWWSNKNNEIFIRHSALFWIGAYMIMKYFVIFGSYLAGGFFFIASGCFLIGLVYVLLKVNKYLENK